MDRQNLSVEVLADRLLEKLDQAIGELNQEVTTKKVKIKEEDGETVSESLEIKQSIISRTGLKQLTSVLKELQEIKAEFSLLELQESQDGSGVILLAPRKEEINDQYSLEAPGEADSVSGADGI